MQLAYEERGAGDPPFVFIHGWACDRSAWLPQISELSAEHSCMAVDLRGRGDSPAEPPYDMLTAAHDVAALMRGRELGPAIVVGHSLGGITALLLNHVAPELVTGVVACDSPLRPNIYEALSNFAGTLRDSGSLESARVLVDSFFGPAAPEAVKQHVREMMLSASLEVAMGMLDTHSYPATLEELLREADEKPAMAIWAGQPGIDVDGGRSGRSGSNWLRQVTRFWRQELVPEAGHFVQLEQPAVANALLRAFLDDVRRDPRTAAKSST